MTQTDDDLTRDALRVLNQHAVALPTSTDLASLRAALEPLLFDGDLCRDDVAEVCQRIDDVLGEHRE
jgi:uncharacterized membrane protein